MIACMNLSTYPDSYYVATAKQFVERPKLEEDIRSDICVIGGGLTGINAALNLAEKGYSVVVLESERVGWGASGRNGGHAGGNPRHGVDELEQTLGKDDAQLHWDLNRVALKYCKDLIAQHNIDCDWRDGQIHACFNTKETEETKRHVEHLHRHYKAEHISFLAPEEIAEKIGTNVYAGGERNSESGHLHPLNYILGLAKAAESVGVRIFENSRLS